MANTVSSRGHDMTEMSLLECASMHTIAVSWPGACAKWHHMQRKNVFIAMAIIFRSQCEVIFYFFYENAITLVLLNAESGCI